MRQRRKFHVTQALPVWTPTHSNAANLVFQSAMLKLRITDIPSYFRKLRLLIVISVIVCMLSGASHYGIKGFILGALLGLAAPAALIWLCVLAIGIALYMVVWCAAWAVIWWIAWWILHS